MSDTLREALEELAAKWELSVKQVNNIIANAPIDDEERAYQRGGNDSTRRGIHQLRTILAAHPADSAEKVVTVYGVRLRSGDVERAGTNILDAEDWLKDMTGGDDPDYEPVEVVTRTTTTSTNRTAWKPVSE